MVVNVPKILCHPDGSIFCNWHRDADVCASYFSDRDEPPAPESLGIEHGSVTEPRDLKWFPVTQIVRVPAEVAGDTTVSLISGPYYDDTGETV
jgi:hypothetical protein